MGVGRPARIDRERVLAEALALADERELDAVTMAALAQRLEVTPMAGISTDTGIERCTEGP